MRITITCPKCKKNCSLIDEKKFIKLYGKCNKCALEEQLGHQYNKPEKELLLCKKCEKPTITIHGCCKKCGTLKLYKEDFK